MLACKRGAATYTLPTASPPARPKWWEQPWRAKSDAWWSEGQIPARHKTPAWENVPPLLRRRLECQRREVTTEMAARGGRFIGIPSWRRRLTEALAGPGPHMGGATSGLGPLAGFGVGGRVVVLWEKTRITPKKTPPPNALPTIFKQLIPLESLGTNTSLLPLRDPFRNHPLPVPEGNICAHAQICLMSCATHKHMTEITSCGFSHAMECWFWKRVSRMTRQQVWRSSHCLITLHFHFPPSGVTPKCYSCVAQEPHEESSGSQG